MASSRTSIPSGMKKKSNLIIFVFGIITSLSAYSQSEAGLRAKDLQVFLGSWQGSLTYLDYTSGKPYTMPANLEVKQIGSTNAFRFSHSYPNEPKANSSDTLLLSTDGRMLNEEIVRAVRILPDSNQEIITAYRGKDGNDNKPALIRHTYLVGPKTLHIRKDILFDGQTKWIERNEYRFTRN
jgi:hypothetical protein